MQTVTDKNEIKKVLSRSIDTIYPTTEEFSKALASGKRLTIYLGVDPTSPHLHVGHAAAILTLARFQKLGHRVVLLLGDFTAQIGDPTDKLAARQPLTKDEVKKNMKTFKAQVSKILSFSGQNPAEIKYNSKWHAGMTFEKVLDLADYFTVQQMIERDMFQKRLKEGKPISLREFFYPLMQGYDSVAMDVDAEIGGTDQIFNMLAGRTLMKSMAKKEKFVIATKLLVDAASGKKLSKTEGSLINLDDAPNDMFGKTMAIPDEMILPLAELATKMEMEEIQKLQAEKNPRDAKLRVAHALVSLYHSEKDANTAEDYFIKTFSKKEVSENIPSLPLTKKTMHITDALLVSGIPSKSEARRLLAQGAIQVNQKVISEECEITFSSGDILKVGKKKFFRIQ